MLLIKSIKKRSLIGFTESLDYNPWLTKQKKVFKDLVEMLMPIKSLLCELISVIHY